MPTYELLQTKVKGHTHFILRTHFGYFLYQLGFVGVFLMKAYLNNV